MSRFLKLASGVDTLPVLMELHRNAQLWNAHPMRKTFPGTPHAAMDDVIVRFRPEWELTEPEAYRTEHRNVMWPAWHLLPSLRPIVRALKVQVDATELGSILLTRLPPGGVIGMHDDRGSWAAEFYRTKAHLVLAGSAISTCDGEEAVFSRGDCFTWDNMLPHSVTNHGTEDRIVVVISMRTDP